MPEIPENPEPEFAPPGTYPDIPEPEDIAKGLPIPEPDDELAQNVPLGPREYIIYFKRGTAVKCDDIGRGPAPHIYYAGINPGKYLWGMKYYPPPNKATDDWEMRQSLPASFLVGPIFYAIPNIGTITVNGRFDLNARLNDLKKLKALKAPEIIIQHAEKHVKDLTTRPHGFYYRRYEKILTFNIYNVARIEYE